MSAITQNTQLLNLRELPVADQQPAARTQTDVQTVEAKKEAGIQAPTTSNIFSRYGRMATRKTLWYPTVNVDTGTQMFKLQINDCKIMRIPTFVGINIDEKVVSFGDQAKESWGIRTQKTQVVCPMRDGLIEHSGDMKMFLKAALEFYLAEHGITLMRPNVLFAVPTGTTDTDVIAQEGVIRSAWPGISHIRVTDEAMAAAAGSTTHTDSPHGFPIADFGGGTTCIAAIGLNDIIRGELGPARECVKGGGRALNEAIMTWVLHNMRIKIDEKEAEKIKETIGCAVLSGDNKTYTLSGHQVGGIFAQMVKAEITEAMVLEAIQPCLKAIYDGILRFLDKTPIGMSSFIQDTGINLAGGGANLAGLGEGILQHTNLATRMVDDPGRAVIRGLKRISESESLMVAMAYEPRHWKMLH